MNKFYQALRATIVSIVLLLHGLTLSAQPISEVNNTNLNQFLAEMQQYFGQIMNVSNSQLGHYMQAFVSGGNSGYCGAPSPAVISQSAHQITFRWHGTPGDQYRIGYVNLLTGERETSIINSIQHTFEIPDGFYQFLFQRICNGKNSNAVIIILDKVVALTDAPDLECDCVSSEEYTGIEVDGMSLATNDEMDIAIRNETDTDDVIFQMHMQKACSDCNDYLVNSYCDDNPVSYINNINFVDVGDLNNVLLITGTTMTLELNLATGYEAVVNVCGSAEAGGDGPIKLLQIISSAPGSSYLLRGKKSSSSPIQMRLFNQAGQQVWQRETGVGITHLEQTINLTDLPVGIYFLRIDGSGGSETRKLLRY